MPISLFAVATGMLLLNHLSLHLKFKKLTISLSCNWHVKNLKMHEPQELVKTKNSAFRDEQLSLCPTEKAVASELSLYFMVISIQSNSADDTSNT